VDIRRAVPGESGFLAALWLRSRAASAPSIPPTIHTDEEVHQWFEDVLLPTSEVWVADGAEGPVALMVLNDEWIDQLYVDPASTRRGIGGSLLDHAKTRRPSGLKLWTFQSNLDARRFYKERGFVAVAMTTGDNEEQAPDVCYVWRPVGPETPRSGSVPRRRASGSVRRIQAGVISLPFLHLRGDQSEADDPSSADWRRRSADARSRRGRCTRQPISGADFASDRS